MFKAKRTLALLLAVGIMLTALFSFGCSVTDVIESANTPEPEATASPSPTAQPTPSLTMTQKASMVWMGEDYQTTYAMFVVVFYGTIGGSNRLIWTTLEYSENHETYSLYEPFQSGDLLAYDLFNHEYLFTVSNPAEKTTDVSPSIFFSCLKDISPSLKDASFSASESLLNLSYLYAIANVDFSEIGDVDSLLSGYVYVEPQTIGPWDKKTAVEAFAAVTPCDYILPYWDFIPDTVMPADFYSADAADTEPAVAYTAEQKELMLGIKPDRYPHVVGNISAFFCKVNGNQRIIWTYSIRKPGKDDADYNVSDCYSFFNQEYLFSLSFPKEEHSEGILISDVWQYHSSSSKMLDGMKLLGSCSLTDLARSYSNWGIEYKANEVIDSWAKALSEGDTSYSDVPIPQEEFAALYLDTVPDQYIMPFWEYVEGAVIPDELKELFPESAEPNPG